jgi:allantoinase
VALNGEIAVHYPRIMEAMLKLGWEMMGHGVTNSRIMTGLTREQETAVITETKTMIEKWGVKMRGWLGPGLTETYDSTELLKAAGVDYTCDWVNDDLPYRMKSGLYSVPYTLELNDQPLFNMPSITTEEYQRRICEAFDVLYAEGKGRGRVMCIALHPHLMGAPHRIRYLDRALGYIASHSGVWFATGSEILDAYKAQEPNV